MIRCAPASLKKTLCSLGRQSAALALALVVAFIGAGSAGAQESYEGASGKSVTLGAGVLVKPKYEGSNDYEVIAIPLIIPRFSGGGGNSRFKKFRERVSFKGLDDIRIRALQSNGFEVGPVAGYRSGRDQDDARRLNGLGDIDGGLVLGGYAGYRIGPTIFDVSASTQVTGDDTGVQVRLGVETEQQVSSWMKLTARLGTTISGDDYMQDYFGVTPAQAATSGAGLPVFSADAGIKDVHVQLGSKIELAERWLLRFRGRYARLVGDAADSPVIESEDQLSGSIGLGYRFNLGR